SKLKSVSSLLTRNPKPGTTIPAPPICSIVKVYDTALPLRSTTDRCVVCPGSPSEVETLAEADPLPPLYGQGSPKPTGLVAAVSVMSARRVAAQSFDSRPLRGTLT